MVKLGRLTATFTTVLALMAVSANAASAASRLHLDFEEKEVHPGAPSTIDIVAKIGEEGCRNTSQGSLVTNGKPTDTLAFSEDENFCIGSPFTAFTGTVTSAKIAADGKATIKTSNLIIEMTGPCYYKFATPKLTLKPGFAVGETLSVAKLQKASSSRSCASTKGFAMGLLVFYDGSGSRSVYETVVTS